MSVCPFRFPLKVPAQEKTSCPFCIFSCPSIPGNSAGQVQEEELLLRQPYLGGRLGEKFGPKSHAGCLLFRCFPGGAPHNIKCKDKRLLFSHVLKGFEALDRKGLEYDSCHASISGANMLYFPLGKGFPPAPVRNVIELCGMQAASEFILAFAKDNQDPGSWMYKMQSIPTLWSKYLTPPCAVFLLQNEEWPLLLHTFTCTHAHMHI